MPERSIELNTGAGTDRGTRRALNEDALVATGALFAVADGMGGHEAGEVASAICAQLLGENRQLSEGTTTAAQLQAAIATVDERIREVGESRAGTTVSGVLLVDDGEAPGWLVFNVGDSRTYRLDGGRLNQISVDHSAVQELVESGYLTQAQARVHPRRNVLTRALGTGPKVAADTWLLPAASGDRMLVCSDGLTSELDDEQIAELLTSLADPQDAADALIQAALRAGGRDNITVIVVDALAP